MTLAQRRAALAFRALIVAHHGRSHGGWTRPNTTAMRWLHVRWGVERFADLTAGQARHAARQLHAWRAAVEGRVTWQMQALRQASMRLKFVANGGFTIPRPGKVRVVVTIGTTGEVLITDSLPRDVAETKAVDMALARIAERKAKS